MKISVIIPVFNTDHGYLRDCLTSLVTQDYSDFEVIAVNDGSVNGCETVIREFADKYDSVVLVDQENGGTSVARNTGLSRATGDYIMFVDADDFVSPGCLKTVYAAMEERKCDILFFGYATSYTNREMNRVLKDPAPGLWDRDTLELALLKGDKRLGPVEVGAPWGKLIKSSIIRDNNLQYTPGLIKGQDTVFVLSLLDHCESFSYLSFLGYHYRISGSSVSRRYNPNIVDIMEKTLSAYMLFVDSRGKGEEFKLAVKRKYLKVLLGEYLELLYLHPDSKISADKRKEEYKALTLQEPYRSIIAETDPHNMGFIGGTELNCLKKGRIGTLFFIKKAEMLLRNFVIRKYS